MNACEVDGHAGIMGCMAKMMLAGVEREKIDSSRWLGGPACFSTASEIPIPANRISADAFFR